MKLTIKTCITSVLVGATTALLAQSPVRVEKKILYDAFNSPFVVTDVVDAGYPMPAKTFWAMLKPTLKVGRSINPWTNRVVRDYFFGRYWTHEGAADPIKGSEDLLVLPHTTGLLGKEVETSRPQVIADDIPFHPIMRRWNNYSSRYYPRRMHDWIVGSLQPAYLLTGKEAYSDRIQEMLSFLLYSQYQPDGHNQFVKDFFPDDYTKIMQNGNAKRWRGGWDYLFDWAWKDGYGYQWSLHEPDHHVGANMALAMLEGWQMNGDTKYFQAADEFFTYQLPEYGFHSGIWNGHRYYWTQYGRSGSPNSETSATDNIQALVARTAAMLGYYKKDPVLLEYARGMLWYQVRELKTDGRWYYDGAENPMNLRRFKSHEGVVLNDAISTLVYLIKAGVPVDEFMEPLTRAVIWYRENFETMLPENNFQAWKTFSGGNTVVYVQATTKKVTKVAFPKSTAAPLSVTRLRATESGWEEDAASLTDVMNTGDILKVKFAGVDTTPATVAGTMAYEVITKDSRVLLPELRINAENFPSFPGLVHFPDHLPK